MKQLYLFLAISAVCFSCFSQDSIPLKRPIYKIRITDSLMNVDKGYLVSITDSNLLMMRTETPFGQSPANARVTNFPYQNIRSVTIQKKGASGRAILFSAGGGMVVGAIIGAITYKKVECEPGSWFCLDFGPGFDILGGSLLGGAGGTLIGVIIASAARKTFIIGGKKEKMQAMKTNVLDKAYGPSGK